MIVTTRHRDDRISQTYDASGDAEFTDFPLAVLVNQNSASAAEIVAACLQDHHRAAIIGQRSFGKGTVQEIVDLESDCGAMKLTTASYWRPSGKNIHRPSKDAEQAQWGVSPDPRQGGHHRHSRIAGGPGRPSADLFAPAATNGNGKKPAEPFVNRPLLRRGHCRERTRPRNRSRGKATHRSIPWHGSTASWLLYSPAPSPATVR